MAARTVTVVKPSPDTRLGVRLADVKGNKGVKVTEIDPSSLIFGLISKGETIMSINGMPCSDGHEAAATALKADQRLTLVIAPKRLGVVGRTLSRASIVGKKMPISQVASEKDISDFDGSSSYAAAPTAVRVSAFPMPPNSGRGLLSQQSAPAQKGHYGAPAGAPAQKGYYGAPVGAPSSSVYGKPDLSYKEALAPDEYIVTLHRKSSKSIGMRLVQKSPTDLPFVADIDPNGPAANSAIRKNDLILEVNGVDARASHDELKKALGMSGEDAVLKLRRAPLAGPSGRAYANPNEIDVGRKKEEGGWLAMCCAVPRPAPMPVS
jgi:hypothetical protein